MTSIEHPAEERLVESKPTERSTSRWRDAALALSIAHLFFIESWHGLLFQQAFGYFNRIPINRASLAALLLNLFGLALLLWLAGQWLRRSNRQWVGNLAVCALALVPLNFARTHFWVLTGAKFASLLREPVVIGGALAVVAVLVWFHRYSGQVMRTIYIILSPMVLFTVGNSLWWMVRPPPAPTETTAPVAAPAVSGPRVVWILLDELDQRIGFEARPAGVKMPELSRLYEECFRATNAFPPGSSTMYSLPALTIGRTVRQAKPISASELSFGPGTNRWSQTETILSRARALGFSTALAGWYHPYSRVLGKHLDGCEWGPYSPFEEGRGFTVGEAMLNQIAAAFSQYQQRRLHIRLFQRLESASLQFLTNSPAGLALLHLPIPHHPGIYDPKRDRLTLWNYARNAEYLDNLVLADRLFGRLRAAMERAGTWETTWVILSSDHGWREAATYDGKLDHRVPFIVKAAEENQPALYSRSFNTVLTHDLVLAILKKELIAADQLPTWIDAHRFDPPAGYTPTGEPF